MQHLTKLTAAVLIAYAAAPAMADIKNLDIYGVAAVGVISDIGQDGKENYFVNNESRIGFRGSKDLPKLGDNVKFSWQVESGFVGDTGASLGARDTWAGLEGNFGKVRVGRLVTPFGETLDWPFANGGVGPVMEATYVAGGGSSVRLSNQVRWDSPNYNGLTISMSKGRGDTTASNTSNVFSAAAHYALGGATLHLGYEADRFKTDKAHSASTLVGIQSPSFNGFSVYAAVTEGKTDQFTADGAYAVGEYKRQATQVALQYSKGDFTGKISYAKNGNLEGAQTDAGGHMLAVQALYAVDPSLVTYVRVVNATKTPETFLAYGVKSRVLLGMEYYF